MSPLIALEEHFFAPPELLSPEISSLYAEQFKHLPGLLEKLQSLGDVRLQEMSRGGVSMQIVSHGPGLSACSPDICHQVNDYLSSKISSQQKSFAGLAALPMLHPEAAAAELKRCINELGFVGAMIDSHVNGKYYDGNEFRPVFHAAQELDVPLYLHPMFPTASQMESFQGNFLPGAARSMATSGWSWHSNCGLHFLRLFASGLFDEVPRLQIILGHFGEMLPFMLDRIQQLSVRWGTFDRDFLTVWKENAWVTTSGVWSVDPMATTLRNTSWRRILFSVDFPFASSEDGSKFWKDFQDSGMVGQEELEGIAWRNSARLFKLKHELLE